MIFIAQAIDLDVIGKIWVFSLNGVCYIATDELGTSMECHFTGCKIESKCYMYFTQDSHP